MNKLEKFLLIAKQHIKTKINKIVGLFRPIKEGLDNLSIRIKNSKYYPVFKKYFAVSLFVAFVLSWFLAFIIYAGLNSWNFQQASKVIFVNALINNFLGINAILIGVLITIGYRLSGRNWNDTILGFIKGAIGVLMLSFGAGLLIGTARPIFLALASLGGSGQKIIPLDPYFGQTSSNSFFEKIDTSFASVIYLAVVIGFAVNLILVALKKFTNLRTIFVTGHIMIQHAGIFSVMIYLLAFNANGIFGQTAILGTAVLAGIACGVYWSYGSSLNYYATQKVTENGGFAVGHQQMIAISIAYKLGKFFGREEESAENLKLSKKFRIFEDNIFTQTVIIFVIFLILVLVIQFSGSDTSSGSTGGSSNGYNGTKFWHYDNGSGTYIVNTTHEFSVNGQKGTFGNWSAGKGTFWFTGFLLGVFKIVGSILVIVYGVRTFVTELQQSFTGISDRLLPNSSVAVDVAATYGYGQNSVTLGFISGTIGQFLSVSILYAIKVATGTNFPVLIPIFITLFFNSGAIGIYANRSGGWKASIAVPFIFGFIAILVSASSIYAVSSAFEKIKTAQNSNMNSYIDPFSVGYNGMADPNFFFGLVNLFMSINGYLAFIAWAMWVIILLLLAQFIKFHDEEKQTTIRKKYDQLVVKLFRTQHRAFNRNLNKGF